MPPPRTPRGRRPDTVDTLKKIIQMGSSLGTTSARLSYMFGMVSSQIAKGFKTTTKGIDALEKRESSSLGVFSKFNKEVIKRVKSFRELFDIEKKLSRESREASKSLDLLGRSLSSMNKNLSQVKTLAALGVAKIAEMSRAAQVGSSVKSLSLSLQELRSHLGMSEEEFTRLRNGILESARSLHSSGLIVGVEDIDAALKALVSSGARAKDRLEELAPIAILVKKSMKVGEEEAAAFAYRLRHDVGLLPQTMKDIINYMSALTESYNINTEQLLSATLEHMDDFRQVSGMYSKEVAVNLQKQVAATMAILSTEFIQDSKKFGDLLVQVFTKPTSEAADALSKIGIPYTEIRQMLLANDLPRALQTISGRLSSYLESAGNVPEVLEALSAAFGISAADLQRFAALYGKRLIESFEGVREANRKIIEDTEYAAKKVAVLESHWTKAVERFAAAVGIQINSIASLVSDAFGYMVNISSMIFPMIVVLKEFGLLPTLAIKGAVLKTLGTVRAAITGLFAFLIKGIPGLSLILRGILGVFAWFGKAVLAALLGPVGIAAAAIAAIIGGIFLYSKYKKQINEFIAKLWEGINNFIKGAIESLPRIVNSIIEFIRDIPSKIRKIIQDMFKPSGEVGGAFKTSFASFMKDAATLGWELLKGLFKVWVVILTELVPALAEIFYEFVIDPIVKWFKVNVVDAVVDSFNRIVESIKSFASSIFETVTSPFVKAWKFLFGNTVYDWSVVVDSLKSAIGSVFGVLVSPFKKAADFISGIVGKPADMVSEVVAKVKLSVDKIGSFFSGMISEVKDLISSIDLTSITESFKRNVSLVIDSISSIDLSPLIGTMSRNLESIKSMIAETFDLSTVIETMKRNLSAVKSAIAEAIDVSDIVSSIGRNIRSIITTIAETLDITPIVRSLQSASELILEVITYPFKKMVEIVKGIFSDVVTIVKTAVEAFWNVLPWYVKKPLEYVFGPKPQLTTPPTDVVVKGTTEAAVKVVEKPVDLSTMESLTRDSINILNLIHNSIESINSAILEYIDMVRAMESIPIPNEAYSHTIYRRR